MVSLKLWVTALALELGAWISLLKLQSHSDAALATYLALHAGASCVVALCLLPIFWSNRSQSRWQALALIAFLSFSIPILGFFLVFMALLILRAHRGAKHSAGFHDVHLPEYDHQQKLRGGFRQPGMGSFLSNVQASPSSRLRALLALQHVSGHLATPLLRSVLQDHNEELRMLAFGMLDTREEKLQQAIDRELKAFDRSQTAPSFTDPDNSMLEAAEHLAELYWDMSFHGLAQGDMRDWTLEESLRYADLVLAHQPNHASMWLLRGKLLFCHDRYQHALDCYAKSIQYGLPALRARPYQAEVAFRQRNFAEVRALLSDMDTASALPKVRAVANFWRSAG